MTEQKKYKVLPHQDKYQVNDGEDAPGFGDSFTRKFIGQTLTEHRKQEEDVDWLFERPSVHLAVTDSTYGVGGGVTFPLDVLEEVTDVPETEYIGGVAAKDLREGDIIGYAAGTHFSVTRVKEPEVPKPAPGTFGTAVVNGKRVPGLIDEDGDFAYLKWDIRGYVERSFTSPPVDFEADA